MKKPESDCPAQPQKRSPESDPCQLTSGIARLPAIPAVIPPPLSEAEYKLHIKTHDKAYDLVKAYQKLTEDAPGVITFVVDDTEDKVDYAVNALKEAQKSSEARSVAASCSNGDDAIKLLAAVRKEEIDEARHEGVAYVPAHILVIMDGYFESRGGGAVLGNQVVRKIVDLFSENGWQLPYFVSYSVSERNSDIEKAAGDRYLGNFSGRDLPEILNRAAKDY